MKQYWAIRVLAPLAAAALLSACGGGGSGGGSGGNFPSPPPQDPAYVCPSSGASAQSARPTAASSGRPPRRLASQARYAPGLVAVLYDRSRFAQAREHAVAAEVTAGARLVREHDYPRIGEVSRVLAAEPAKLDGVMAALRSQPGVKDVGRVALRYPSAITTPYFTNDPYFVGFPPTTPPYYESAGVPGQWDMHAIELQDAWAYSQSNNGSTITNAGALGRPSVSIAIIDTGEDLSHPELAGSKVVHTGCFITNPTTGVQTQSTFVTDEDGHGTDVAGIAGDTINNAFGFVGAGGNASLMAYRVFPTPDNNCLNPGSTDPQCSALSSDIASAIDDAVSNGARIVNMSFGGSCPDDDIEGPAVANAIAQNVIVVAAAGNAGNASIDAPACDPGVIPVGASALADGKENGSNDDASGEYVASYSNHGSGAWGIVAPGGDPNCPSSSSQCNDTDNLHWIQNIYTSTPLDAQFAGLCAPDYPKQTGKTDCRILIAGTSMATPMVSGAAALILSASGGTYATPLAMGNLLCSTADDIDAPNQGCGRLDVYNAMAQAVGDPSPPSLPKTKTLRRLVRQPDR